MTTKDKYSKQAGSIICHRSEIISVVVGLNAFQSVQSVLKRILSVTGISLLSNSLSIISAWALFLVCVDWLLL